jgi:hypothetical protein
MTFLPISNTHRNISSGVIDRVFTKEKISFEAAYYHQSASSAFFWGLLHLGQEEPENKRELEKKEDIKYIATCLQDNLINIIKSENKATIDTEIISSDRKKIFLQYSKTTDGQDCYKIIQKEDGLFLNKEEILYEINDVQDFVTEIEKQCNYVLAEDYTPNCFGYNINAQNLNTVNKPHTPLPQDTPFFIFSATLCKIEEKERKENEEKNIYLFDGSDLFGNIDMEPIYQKIDELTQKGKSTFILHGFSRGCYTVLAVSKKYSKCDFFVYLIDPMKGPFKNKILESNIIPKNVLIANIAYGGKIFFGHFGYRAFLACQSYKTKVNIIYDSALAHNDLCSLGRADGTSRYDSEEWQNWDPRTGCFPKSFTYYLSHSSNLVRNPALHGPTQNILNQHFGRIHRKDTDKQRQSVNF